MTPLSVSEYEVCKNSMSKKSDFKNSLGMIFKKIPSGSFKMGNCPNRSDGGSDELLCHSVNIKSFYLAQAEVA